MSAWRQVEDAIAQISDGQAKICAHDERRWDSATFTGTKHDLVISFAGEDAILIGEAMLEELPSRQFRLPDHLVADATIVFTHRSLTERRLDFRLELLLVELKAAA